jgi:hypothetical protein
MNPDGQTARQLIARKLHVRVLEFLFLDNPRPTALAILAGIVLSEIVDVLRPALKGLAWLNTDAVSTFGLIAACVFVANIGRAARAWRLPAEMDAILAQIRHDRDAGHLSARDEQRLYLKLMNALVASILNGKLSPLPVDEVIAPASTAPSETLATPEWPIRPAPPSKPD